MKQNWLTEFSNPTSAYRSKPFWAWNGKLEESELRRQIRVMRRMGMGGFFMHSRVGLATPYLSGEWHDLVKACVDEAQKQGMEAWLYDEDRWPSGAAGGLVTRNPKYRQTVLVMEQVQNPKSLRRTPATIAMFTAHVRGNKAANVKRVMKGQRPTRLPAGEVLLVFRVAKAHCSDWYNGFTYLDTLNHEAVREFIKTTHESYRKHVGRHFGKTIPGIFTDEPNYGSCLGYDNSGITMPWTANLPRVFKARYGYDLVPHLPELYFDIDGAEISQARYHYHDCITFLFVDAFVRQIGEWCARNNLDHTGHVLAEQTLLSQTSVVGSCMRFYEYMQAPGIDLLTERSREYDTAKQASSAARQFGRKWRLTETYGCTGWDFAFAGHKAQGDWQAAMGINLRCPHLSWYTMEGEAKRDYPASILFQSPWWKSYSKVEDYFARIHLVMTRGEEARNLLVIHPVESMWTMCRLGWARDKKVQACDRMFVALRDSLLTEHIDFDYGDEDILSRHGRVRRTRKGPALAVGKAVYKAVLVPPLVTMRKSTLALLKKFHAQGGTVVFAGSPAGCLDAVPSTAVREFAGQCVRAPARGKELAAAVEKTCRRVSVADEIGNEIPSALYLLREDEDACYLFVCNTGHKRSQLGLDQRDVMVRERKEAFAHVFIRISCHCQGQPLELDPDSGSVMTAEARRRTGSWEIRTSFPALGSRLFVIPKRQKKSRFPARKTSTEIRKKSLIRSRWPIVLSESNNVVFDRPRYRIGTGKWMSAEEILRVDGMVRDKLGIPRRGGAMVQPWARTRAKQKKSIPIELSYSFDVETLPTGGLSLAIEQPGRYRILINGNELSTDAECGWWVDPSLRKIPVDTGLLRQGQNEILLACDYDEEHPGLEIIYLLGAFGVRVKGASVALTDTPSSLRIGDWCGQGLPFYSGSVTYLCSIAPNLRHGERFFLTVPSYRGVAVRVLVNGQAAGIMAWQPNEIDITDCLSGCSNDLRIEVLGHRRNSHGPLHHREKNPTWTGPAQFVTGGRDWKDTFQLVPCGLMQAPCLSVRSGGTRGKRES